MSIAAYSTRQTDEYKKAQSIRCQRNYTVNDPDGNKYTFKSATKLIEFFKALNGGIKSIFT